MVASRPRLPQALRHGRPNDPPGARRVRVRPGRGARRVTFEIITHGIHELRAAFEDVNVKVEPEFGKALSRAAIPVKADVQRRAAGYSALTVAGVRIRRRRTVVRVEQGQRKTTGYHAQYGG